MLFRTVIITAFILAQSLVAYGDQHKDIPVNVRKQIEQRWIGTWDETTEYDGKKESALFSWKWGDSQNVLVSDWEGPDFSATGIGYWDADTKEFVMQGQTTRGDY